MKKIILITGGAGYIGSHAVIAFEQAGYKTVIIDNFANSSRENLDGIAKNLGYEVDFFECDIADRDTLKKIFEKYQFDGVLHFAGLKAVWESTQKPFEYYKNNFVGTVTLAEVMESFDVKKMIFSSSATVYSYKNISPFTEEMLLGTTNPYWSTKLIIEKFLEDLSKFADWQVTSLRYFNPIGAHSSGIIGEIPRGVPNNLLPYVLDVAKGKREKVLVFGNDYPTPDGTGIRDYIDINDLVEAHLLAYENLSPKYEVFNIGTGKWTSVLEIITLTEKISGQKIPYKVVSRREWDLGEAFSSAKKIKEKLGWESKKAIEESIASAWNFVKNRK